MLEFIEVVPAGSDSPSVTLTLSMEQRVRSRQKVVLDNGVEAGLFLPRGTILNRDDVLKAKSGELVCIVAADESVSTVYEDDPLKLARASYHLGNRHVPLQIGTGFVRYQHDHVLDDMVIGLGLKVTAEQAAFEPEAGAYGGSHGHAHSHSHSHEQHHQHEH